MPRTARGRIAEIFEARGTAFDPVADLMAAFAAFGCMWAELMKQSVISWRSAAAFGALGFGITSACLLATRSGTGWVQAVFAAVAVVLAVYALLPRERETPEPVAIDSKMFMPYSVCPTCGVEGLHWLKSAEITDFSAFFHRACDFTGIDVSRFSAKEVELIGREWAAKRMENCDVLRECRDCGHTWGQRVVTGVSDA